MACGGYTKSIQFKWLKKLGHSIEEPVSPLFTFNIPDDSISFNGNIGRRCNCKNRWYKVFSTRLFTYNALGVEWPVVLKLSAFAARELHKADYKFSIFVNWLPL